MASSRARSPASPGSRSVRGARRSRRSPRHSYPWTRSHARGRRPRPSVGTEREPPAPGNRAQALQTRSCGRGREASPCQDELEAGVRALRGGLMLGCTLALLAAPLAVDAQQSAGRVHRLGYLSTGSATATYVRPLEAFRQGLRDLGWIEGQNIVIEYRYAEGQVDRLPGLAEELVRAKVDVIAAAPTPAALAAKNATRTIPIVGMGLTEPVALGVVESLARPG